MDSTELRALAAEYRQIAERERNNSNLTEAAQYARKARQLDTKADQS